jgi:2-methylisocitrate lyase-like PEP mutase family enzyme
MFVNKLELSNISTGALALYPDGVESAAYQYTTLTSDLRVVCPNNIMADILTKYFKQLLRSECVEW